MRLVPTSSPTAEAVDLVLEFDIVWSPDRRYSVRISSVQNLAVALRGYSLRGRVPPDHVLGRVERRSECVARLQPVGAETEQRHARQGPLVVVAQSEIVERQVRGPVRVIARAPVRRVH